MVYGETQSLIRGKTSVITGAARRERESQETVSKVIQFIKTKLRNC